MRTLWDSSSTDLSQNPKSLQGSMDRSTDEDIGAPLIHLQTSPNGSRIRIQEDQPTQSVVQATDLVRRFLEVTPERSNSTQVEAHIPNETRRSKTYGRNIKTSNGEDVRQSVLPTMPEEQPSPCVKVKHLCQMFPFHIVLNNCSEILQTGPGLEPLLPTPSRDRLSFKDCFDILYPVRDTTSDHFDLLDPDIPLTVTVHPKWTSTSLYLKGEMHSLPELSILLFLPFPLSTDDPTLAQHLVSRDLNNISQEVRRERRSRQRLHLIVADLKERRSKVEDDRGQTDDLLSSIFPAFVVDRLRMRRPVDPVTFDLVTILFADIVKFTALCGDPHVTPMDVVRMLNQLYTQFDLLSSLNDVYKVETIGDAYMVVGGFPVFTPRHADVVISMAFEMIRASQSVFSPVNHLPLQVRIGVHSGGCVAGVVGYVMPRYCLFGRTVALANQMETLSEPDMINISEDTLRCISVPDVYQFEENLSVPQDLPCRSFFISQTPASPVLHTLDLPVPRGLFRTPVATPQSSPSRHASRQTTPHVFPEENKSTPRASPTRHGSEQDPSNSCCPHNFTKTTPNISPFRHAHNEATPNGLLFRYSPNQTSSNGSLFQYPPTKATPNGSPCSHASGTASSNDTPSLSAAIAYSKGACIAEEYGFPHQVHQRNFQNSPELAKDRYNALFSCSTSIRRNVCQSCVNHAPKIHLNDLPVDANTAHSRCAVEQITSIGQSYNSTNDNSHSRQSNGGNVQSPSSRNDQSSSVSAPSASRSYSWCCFSMDSSRHGPNVNPTSVLNIDSLTSVLQGEKLPKNNHRYDSCVAPPTECPQTKPRRLWETRSTKTPQCGRANVLHRLSKDELQRIKQNSRLVIYFRPQARSMSPSSERSSSDDDRRRSVSVWSFRDVNEFVCSEAGDQR